jgi:two-component system, OmpR family, sensor histidine kinase KdpD
MMDGGTARNTARQAGLGLLGIAAVTLICFPLHVNFAIPAFLYLLTVVLLSPAGGFASSAVVSLVAVLCLDYFFTPPILHLDVASPIDGVTLAAYLLTSLIITRLATEARQQAMSAKRRERVHARLYQIIWRLFSIEPQAVSGTGTVQIYRELLDFEGLCLFDANTGKTETAGKASPSLAENTQNAYQAGRDYIDEPSRIWIRCLQVAGKRIGAIGFQGLSETELMAAPLSMLAGAALERAESFQIASTAAATSQVETLRSAIVDAFAHEFKTPLSAILTAAGGIRETRELTAQQFEMVELIEVETVRLSKLATRLLVTARLDRDEVQPRLELTNLTDLIARMVTRWPADGTRVCLELGTEEVEVASDQELLTLALTQLLDNAFKYAPHGQPIRVSLESHADTAVVRVSNRGSFVPMAERERIFERFHRGAATCQLASGAGLGLYVARKIAVAHGGSLDLEDYAPGESETAFCLKMPIFKIEAQHVLQAS